MSQRKPRILIKCACGCGQDLICVDEKGRDRKYLQGHNTRNRRWSWGEESRIKLSQSKTGTLTRGNNPRWNGGRYVDVHGYVWVLHPDHPNAATNGYIREHRLVLEQKLGRLLLPEEIPHHLNGIKDDNRPENLVLYSCQSSHLKEGHYAKN